MTVNVSVTYDDNMDNLQENLYPAGFTETGNKAMDLPSQRGGIVEYTVRKITIESVSVEYVVSESEFYVEYDVGFYVGCGMEDTLRKHDIIRLTHEDLEETIKDLREE